MTYNLAYVKEFAKKLGFSIRNQDGEIRINKRGATEATAYYTNDYCDAIGTMIAWNRK